MRWLAGIALTLLIGCAQSQEAADAGSEPDMSAGHCDAQQLFAMCSAQCGMKVCIVAAASCQGTDWVCDCSKVGPCLVHD